jgi:CO/xanthine dehydrogenase Mo-binding subunit
MASEPTRANGLFAPRIHQDHYKATIPRRSARVGGTRNGKVVATPDCGKTSASRQTFVTGKATELPGRALRKEIFRMTNAGQDARLTFSPGRVRVRQGSVERHITLAELPADQRGYALDPPTTPLDGNGQGEPYAVYGFGAHMVELEVDHDLGSVRLVKITAAHDVGTAINHMLVEADRRWHRPRERICPHGGISSWSWRKSARLSHPDGW